MKRVFFFALLTALNISFLCAQRRHFDSQLYLGFGGGVLSSRVDFVPSIQQPLVRLGGHGGVAAKFISSEAEGGGVRAGVIGELNFSQRGWEEIFSEEDIERGFSYSRALNYLDIPFMTHLNAGRGSVRFILNAGPQISILLNDRQRMSEALADFIEENPISPRFGMQYQSIEHLRRVDYGLIGGIGLQIRTGVGNFNLEGRYYFGLGDVFESRRSRQAHFSRSAHRVIQVRLTYYWRVF
jgi:hypothetical protein